MNKELLEKYITEGKTLREISYLMSKSYSVVRHWIKKHKISFTRSRGPKSKTGVKLNREQKIKMSTELQKKRSIRRKLEFIQILGGECCSCGYKKNWAALDFHHKDPSQKRISMDLTSLGHYSQDILDEEIKKCSLLCSNCHREHHHPDKFIN